MKVLTYWQKQKAFLIIPLLPLHEGTAVYMNVIWFYATIVQRRNVHWDCFIPIHLSITSKKNIGLIEVMGLAVLPSRLAEEMNAVKEALLSGKDLNDDPLTVSHAEWGKEIAHNNPDISKENVSDIICKEIGKVFEQVLLDAGVFKRNSTGRQAFYRFIYTLSDGGQI